MYIPNTSSIPDSRFIFASPLPLQGLHFSLDISGVLGIFGGDEILSSMTSAHLSREGRWLGWYNSPGSYQIARQCGRLARSRFFERIFPGERADPAKLFDLDGRKGPKFTAVHSGDDIPETGHIAALFMKRIPQDPHSRDIGWRLTTPHKVMIAELNVPHSSVYYSRTRSNTKLTLFAIFTIGVSIGTSIACAIYRDWYSFSAILLGILASGCSRIFIGSGQLMFHRPSHASSAPPGDGILRSDWEQFILLKGSADAVSSITRGRFTVNFDSEPNYNDIGWCSLFLIIQFIVQLLLIPQGSLFGQIMFVTSLAASWVYSLSLSPLDMEKIQRDILFNNVLKNWVFTKYVLGTRTTTVVFILLVFQSKAPYKLLNELLPNDTRVWKYWKDTIVQRLLDHVNLEFVESDWETPTDFTEEERRLLETLYRDSRAAYDGYKQYVASN